MTQELCIRSENVTRLYRFTLPTTPRCHGQEDVSVKAYITPHTVVRAEIKCNDGTPDVAILKSVRFISLGGPVEEKKLTNPIFNASCSMSWQCDASKLLPKPVGVKAKTFFN